MGLRVVFLGGPADGTHRDYPQLEIPLPRLYLYDYRTGRPGAAYGRLDDHPTPDGTWRYQLSTQPTHPTATGPTAGQR